MKVDLFVPCFVNQFAPEVAFSMIKVLEKLGCEVQVNLEQTCCGQFAYKAGHWQEAQKIAEKFIQDFTKSDNYIVAPSASCIAMIRHEYDDLLPNTPREQRFSIEKRALVFSEFLTEVLEVERVEGAKFEAKAAYLDTCQALRICGIQEAPRELLYHVEGLNLYEIEQPETCCGFGGNFACQFEHISAAIAEAKIAEAESLDLDYLITSDMDCGLHLNRYLQQKGSRLQVKHLAEVLASGWEF